MSVSTCIGSSHSNWSVSSESCLNTPDVARRLFQEASEGSEASEEALEFAEAAAEGKADLKHPLLGSSIVTAPWQGTAKANRVYWEAFFVLLPIFCGYATLFGLQHKIKARFRIADDNSAESHSFGFATSFLYLFNLISRFGHAIFFSGLTPRERVFLAMLAMAAAMMIIAVPIMMAGEGCFFWVAFAYSLGGVAVGSFESNFLCCLTPLGHRTKHVAITAIPVGITMILVGAFLLMGPPLHVPATAVYVAVACLVLIGMVLMSTRIPPVSEPRRQGAEGSTVADHRSGLWELVAHGRRWRAWLPQMWHYPWAFAIDQLALSACQPGVALFLYNRHSVDLDDGFTIPTNIFFAFVNTFNMLGGVSGRWLSYRLKPRHPMVYTLFSAVGVSLILLRIPRLAPFGSFCLSLGDGLIYGTTSRHIDTSVAHEFNLTAISLWLFIGDLGSVTGSNLISYLRDWVVGV